MDAFEDEDELEDEQLFNESDDSSARKRRRRAEEESARESAEYADYNSRFHESAMFRDQDRKERQLEAFEILAQTLKVASANLEVTQKILEISTLHSAALARLLEK